MPRIGYIDESKKTPQITEMIESAKKTGAPDPRVVSIMTRSEVGTAVNIAALLFNPAPPAISSNKTVR